MGIFSIKFALFLLALIFLYYFLPKKVQWIILLVFSLFYYLIVGGKKAFLFVTLTIISTFVSALFIQKLANEYKGKIADKSLRKEEKLALKRINQNIRFVIAS